MTKLLETIKAVDGAPLHVAYHQARLDYSMRTLRYASHYHLASLLSPPINGICRCRVIYDDQSIHIEYLPYQPKPIRSLQIVTADHIDYSLKYFDRSALNSLYEQRGTCDDVAIIKNGLLSDTTIANIALFDGRQWHTPKNPLLRGTTRQRLLEHEKLVEKEITLESIPSYQRCAVFNAMTGFIELEDGIIF